MQIKCIICRNKARITQIQELNLVVKILIQWLEILLRSYALSVHEKGTCVLFLYQIFAHLEG